MKEAIPSNEAKLEARYRTMLILWVALVLTLGVYYLFSLFAPGAETAADQRQLISLVLPVLGISLAIISLVVRRGFSKQAEEKQAPALVQTGLIVALALCETIGLLGLVDHFLTGNRYYFIMFVMALIAMLFHFPSRNQLALASYRQIEPN